MKVVCITETASIETTNDTSALATLEKIKEIVFLDVALGLVTVFVWWTEKPPHELGCQGPAVH